MKLLIAFIFSGLILGIVMAGDDKPQPATSWIGNRSGINQTKEVVIEDADSWKKLWEQIHSTREPIPDVPEIDFSSHIVVGYFLGQRSTGGYSVSLEDIQITKNEIIVTVATTAPKRGTIVSQAITSPYAIQAIQKSHRNVRFIHAGQ